MNRVVSLVSKRLLNQQENLVTRLVKWIPGKLGTWLRQLIYSSLLKQAGEPIAIGLGSQFRGTDWIELGNEVCVDCNVYIDALANVHFPQQVQSVNGSPDTRIFLEDSVVLNEGVEVRVHQGSQIEIGQATQIGSHCRLLANKCIKIGKNCQIGSHSSFCAVRPNLAKLFASIKLEETIGCGIVVEDNCWIGSNVKVLDGIRIGQGSVIGDDSVVTEDIPPFSVAVGEPAKILKGLLDEVDV
ncbi:acyltransferase [Phormidium tenue FACHB-886]|nr:acyltransferase [Phormidium tenue FACHB-886]